MRLNLLIFVAGLIFFSACANTNHAPEAANPSIECAVENAELESVAGYLITIAASLTEIKGSMRKIEADSKNKNVSHVDTMLAFKEIRFSFNCASGMVTPFKKSKNKTTAESATQLSKAFLDLALGVDAAISNLKLKLDNPLEPAGEAADRDSDLIILSKQRWEAVVSAVVLGTTAVTEKVDPKSQKVKRFFISRAERDQIVHELRSQFILPMKSNNPTSLDQLANSFYLFLLDLNFH